MTFTARLVGGPSDGQTFILEADTVNYVDPNEPGDDTLTYYVFAGTDPQTGEHLFRWNGATP